GLGGPGRGRGWRAVDLLVALARRAARARQQRQPATHDAGRAEKQGAVLQKLAPAQIQRLWCDLGRTGFGALHRLVLLRSPALVTPPDERNPGFGCLGPSARSSGGAQRASHPPVSASLRAGGAC